MEKGKYEYGMVNIKWVVVVVSLVAAIFIGVVAGLSIYSAATDSPPTPGEEEDEKAVISTLSDEDLPSMPQVPELGNSPDEWDETQAENVPAVLRFRDGDEVAIARNSEWIDGEDGMMVFVGDVVEVKEGTTATLHFLDGSVSALVGYCEAELVQSERADEGTIVELEIDEGSIITKVGKLFSSSSSHKVRTPNSIAGAWGTVYRVKVFNDGETECSVSEGEIHVSYVEEDQEGKAFTRKAILKAKQSNAIRIPRLRAAVVSRLAEDLGLEDDNRKSVLDHLDRELVKDRTQGIVNPNAADRSSQVRPSIDLPSVLVDEILSRASTRFNALDSYHFEITQKGGSIPVTDELKLISASGDIDLPDKKSFDAKARWSGIPITVSLVTVGETAYMTDPLSGEWILLPENYSAAKSFDPGAGVKAMLRNLRNAQKMEAQIIDGAACFHIEGELDPWILNALTGGFGIQKGQGDAVSIEAWIDSEEYMVHRVTIEGQMIDGEDLGISRTINLSNFNVPVNITIPKTGTGV